MAMTFDTPKCCCESLRRQPTLAAGTVHCLRWVWWELDKEGTHCLIIIYLKDGPTLRRSKPELGLPQLQVFTLVVLLHLHSNGYYVSASAHGDANHPSSIAEGANPSRKIAPDILKPFHGAKGMHVYFMHKRDAPRNPFYSVFISFQLLPSLFLILVISKVNISVHYRRNNALWRPSEERHAQCWALEQLGLGF